MSLRGRAPPDASPRGPGPADRGDRSQGTGPIGHDPRDIPQSELSTPGSEATPRPLLTPRRLALADAIAGLRGDGPPPGLLLIGSDIATPRAEQDETLDEVPPGAPATTGAIEAARFPLIARGTYDIAGKFAQGGIGRILRAHDPVLGRTVALKELLVAGHRTDEDRFVREVLLTARLQHPGIVPVYAAGRWPSGEPFYAMKLVSGRSFDQVIAEATTLPARLALLPHVLAIAETVAFAHAQGIIHRDLKPNNVLVGEFGETVVIDWGLAKQLGEPEEAHASAELEPLRGTTPPVDATQQLTHVGAIVGTPGFMSPEQADSAAVDARTDVYALGVILYQTLTGRLPYDAENAVELLFKTVYDPPVALQRREPQVPEELAAVVEKAMARDLAARYPTARAFADDLRRFQTGQIVGAHRYTAWELLGRVIRRYRTHLAVAAVALLVVIVTIVVSFRSVAHQRDLAREAESAALAAEADALKAEADAVHARNEAVERADVLALEQARLRVDNDPGLAIDLLARTSPAADWRRIRQIAAAVEQRGIPMVLHGHEAAVSRAVFSPDNTRLATTSDDCTVRVWDLSQRTSRAYFGHADEVWRAAWSQDQRRLATTSRDKTVRVWDLESGAVQVLAGHTSGIRNVTFGPGGRTLYSGDDDRVVRRWDLDSGASEIVDEQCIGSSFPWDERQIACLAAEAGEVRVHDLRTGERTRLRAAPYKLGQNGTTSPDGRLVAAGNAEADALVWDRETGVVRLIELHRGLTDAGLLSREIRFAPSSDRLLVPMARNYLAVHDLRTSTTQLLRPHTGYTRRANFSPDGALIASVGGDIGVRVWDQANASERSLAGAQALMIDVQFSRDGNYLAAVGNDPRVFVWPQRVYRSQMWRLSSGTGAVAIADVPALDLAVVARGRELVLLDTVGLRPRLQLTAPRPLTGVAATTDAALLAGVDDAGELHVWDGRDGALLRTVALASPTPFAWLRPSPTGSRLAVSGPDRPVLLVDLATGELRDLGLHGPTRIEFVGDTLIVGIGGELRQIGPDGAQRVLRDYRGPLHNVVSVPGRARLVAGTDSTLDVWDLERGTTLALTGHSLQVHTLHASKDGRRLVTSSRDNILRVFALDTGELLRTITPPTVGGTGISLSDDGEMLASTTHDGAILVWDLGGGPGSQLEPRLLRGPSSTIALLRFAADGRSLLTIDSDGRAVRWNDDLPRDAAGVRAWVAAHHDPEAAAPATRIGCAARPAAP